MGHACMAESCIFCALKELFSQLQFSNESALPPDALRKALAESFSDQQRFQLGFMDDAAECFENILLRIHMHIAHGESQDMCNAQHCIPHQKFAMTLVEQTVCSSCGATSEPLSYTQMVHYVSTSTLVYQVRNRANRTSPLSANSFGQLLRKAGNMGDIRMCPSNCGAVIQISRTLMNWPEIVSIGLVWNSERPSLEHIMEVFSSIGTTLLLGDVFNSVMDKRWTDTNIHNLVGVVTYYGKHYSTFFFHTKLRVWIYFDDATVRQVGPHWEQVVEKCRKGRYQPLLLLYASPDGTPVNVESAPKQVTQLCPPKNLLKNQISTHSLLRRSITPSPEKPLVGNTRRAITPSPDSPNQKPPIPRNLSDYQNLSVIQNNIYRGNNPLEINRKDPDYVSRKLDFTGTNNKNPIQRTPSNGSSSGIEGGMSDCMNYPRRRDSGNWSGDRNSASSSSSTTMENPYLYLIGKVPQGNGNVPESPTLGKSDSSSAGSVIYDAGYDSYSLSSNDSSTMTTLQHMMKIGHLAKIPEDYNNVPTQISQSCDVLCDEADELLVKSRQLEDEHDLVLALALCNAAATKARAAMNAPYNNPQTLTLARMKHNTCIMRARSLHRRMVQSPAPTSKDVNPEIRHTREGSSGSGRHSRQNSRDKGHHSRQNSKELLTNLPVQEKAINKSIEIYATLPKKKDALKNRLESIEIDENTAAIDKPIVKESRGLFSRSKQKDPKRDKRSRSEDRSKHSMEFSTAPEIKPTKEKPKEEKEEKKDKDKNKKQHKIRRKLLMGGLIRRKNRSMPDLTDTNGEITNTEPEKRVSSVDDSKVGLKDDKNSSNNSGYLSEGHLEFNSSTSSNPILSKSKLMRKSFYASAGKILTAAKVPPPPPLRTTSQLSASKLPKDGKYDLNDNSNAYQSMYNGKLDNSVNLSADFSVQDKVNVNPLEPNNNYSIPVSNTLITTADVHQEHKKSLENLDQQSKDEVDCFPIKEPPVLELPPYPSPGGSAIHSRQPSEEFPPPPPPLDLSALEEHLIPQKRPLQFQAKKPLNKDIFINEKDAYFVESPKITGGDTWLKELQAKQAALRIKRNTSFNKTDEGVDVINTQKYIPNECGSVKDLKSKFEHKNLDFVDKKDQNSIKEMNKIELKETNKKLEMETITPQQISEEIKEVEKINQTLQDALNPKHNEECKKNKLSKKKSVSFCDQVILVATAEDQEDDSYIPNPILERVLRSAINKTNDENKESENVTQDADNMTENAVEKAAADNLFDITMKNTVENSKVLNPNFYRMQQPEPKVVAIAANQSPYLSVAFAHNQNNKAAVPPNNALYSSGQQNLPEFNSHIPKNYNENTQAKPENLYSQNQPMNRNYPYQYPPHQPTNIPNNYPGQYGQNSYMQQSNYYPTIPQSNYNGQGNIPQNYIPNNYPPQYGPPPSNNPMHHQNQYIANPSKLPNMENRQILPNGYVVQNPRQFPIRNQPPTNRSNIYHAVPVKQPQHGVYQQVPYSEHHSMNNSGPYQRLPSRCSNPDIEQKVYDPYQRVPPPHNDGPYPQMNYQGQNQVMKKSVSFASNLEPTDISIAKAVVTPIVVNNANNSIPDKTKCNLCRKKVVASSNLYCADCEYYMSRFKPKT